MRPPQMCRRWHLDHRRRFVRSYSCAERYRLCEDCGQAMVKASPSDADHAWRRDTSRLTLLRTVSLEELAQILSAHFLYLETARKRGKRGNLSTTDLAGHDFSGGDFRRIKLDH